MLATLGEALAGAMHKVLACTPPALRCSVAELGGAQGRRRRNASGLGPVADSLRTAWGACFWRRRQGAAQSAVLPGPSGRRLGKMEAIRGARCMIVAGGIGRLARVET